MKDFKWETDTSVMLLKEHLFIWLGFIGQETQSNSGKLILKSQLFSLLYEKSM